MKTLQLKVRSGQEWLNEAAKEVNLVWNFANETTAKAARPFCGKPRILSGFDVEKLLAGASKELQYLPAQTCSRVVIEHADRRKQFRRSKLSWRKSSGTKRSLGWVPFRRGQLRFIDGAVKFAGRRFRVFDSYGLASFDLRAGSFAQNALGDWFINIAVETPENGNELPSRACGIDLGLKSIATVSDGRVLEAGRWTHAIADKLAHAQRRGHQKHAKRLHRKAANRRKDALHKFTTEMVSTYGAIYIGDVSSVKLAKTRMAKSTLDSGWGMLKAMLQYKGHRAGRVVEIVNEKFTTVTCSNCGCLSGPKGLKQLLVREWACSECGAEHSRDINAARNILARGLSGPSAGTSSGSQAISTLTPEAGSQNAYVKAREPTSALALSLFATFCQMVADDLDAPISVVVQNHVVTKREPK